MADYGVQAEGILKPKGDFHLIEGEDVRDVFLVVNTLEVPIPSTILKDGLLCYNIENASFYKYKSSTQIWDIHHLVEVENGLQTLVNGKIGLGGALNESTIITLANSLRFQSTENDGAGNYSTNFIYSKTGITAVSSYNPSNGATQKSYIVSLLSQQRFNTRDTFNNDERYIGLITFPNFGSIYGSTTTNNTVSLSNLKRGIFIPNEAPNNLDNPTLEKLSILKDNVSQAGWFYDANYYRPNLNTQIAKRWLTDKEYVDTKASSQTIEFSHKNWIGSNFLLSRNSIADFKFYTNKKATTLRTLTINGGSIGTSEQGKTITIVVYRYNASNFSINASNPSLTDIQNDGTSIYSATTVIAGGGNAGFNFQRIFENLNISIPIYQKIYVAVTTNQTNTLNNLSVELELKEA